MDIIETVSECIDLLRPIADQRGPVDRRILRVCFLLEQLKDSWVQWNEDDVASLPLFVSEDFQPPAA